MSEQGSGSDNKSQQEQQAPQWHMIENPEDGTSRIRARIVAGEGKATRIVALFTSVEECAAVLSLQAALTAANERAEKFEAWLIEANERHRDDNATLATEADDLEAELALLRPKVMRALTELNYILDTSGLWAKEMGKGIKTALIRVRDTLSTPPPSTTCNCGADAMGIWEWETRGDHHAEGCPMRAAATTEAGT